MLARLLQACVSNRSLACVRRLHSLILTCGASNDRFVCNHLLNAYSKLEDMASALKLFDTMPRKNLMSWNIVIGGYVQNEDLESARKLFYQMTERNIATWNAMVAGVTNFGFNEEGMGLFSKMKSEGLQPDGYTLGSVLRGCAGVKDAGLGRQIHAYVIRSGFLYDLCVGNSLAHMYMNCGSLEEGEGVLDMIPVRSVVSCNTIIAGRVQNGNPEGAISYLRWTKEEGLAPDQITFTSILSACSELATIGQGQQVHAQVVKTGTDSVLSVRSSLVSMYSKCGCLNDSLAVFSESDTSDYVLWSVVIAACGFHGRGQEAIELFERMVGDGIAPNHVTFLSLLYACSHSGLKECGKKFFKLMTATYNLEPKLEHYTCMVDLLGRSGCLKEAEELINSIPVEADGVIWKTLLSACKTHRNLEMAERAAAQVLLFDSLDSAPYVLLSQIHATSNKWRDVSEVRARMRENMIKKEPGISWVEVRNEVHQFTMGDKSHPRYREVHEYLKDLLSRMKQCGYVPNTSVVLHDMEDEEKECSLLDHSEKLAIAFAILSTPDGAPIRIMKNLRVCDDCHIAIKFISMIAMREIVVRDVSRFHHFKDGECSCGDYW